MTYDPKCHELAMEFLEELNLSDRYLAQKAHELAQNIQNTIEDFFSDLRSTDTMLKAQES